MHDDGATCVSLYRVLTPCLLRKLPEAFGLTVSKSWYPYYLNTEENLNYFGPIPDVSYYCVNEMCGEERREFQAWYENWKSEHSDIMRVLESHYQDDVTFVQLFRREFMHIGNINVFIEAKTIGSASNKVLRKRFLQPDSIRLIPTGGYICNNKYSKKALMSLLHKEQTDGVKIMHGRIGRKYKLPELPSLSLDVIAPRSVQSTSSLIIIFTGTHVSLFVTSAP